MSKPPSSSPPASTFDPLTERFGRNIYQTDKGRIRLALLQESLAGLQQGPPLHILDAGGGQGHMSRWFAGAGHQLLLCDLSSSMLDEARQLNQAAGLAQQIELLQVPLEQFCQQTERKYDLVLCHAVLEWFEQPHTLLAHLRQCLKPGGWLSLMFYNRHSLVLRNALRGNLRKVKRGDWQRDPGSLTPQYPQDPEQVYAELQQLGFSIDDRQGIRCFYDYLPPPVRESYSLDDLLELERDHSRQQPYIHMARYIHVLARYDNGTACD